MTLDGRFNSDVVVHDIDGTTALNVLAMESSSAVASTGKAAITTGTVGTTAIFISRLPFPYTAADGTNVTFQFVDRVAFQANPHAELTTNAAGRTYFSSANRVGIYEMTGTERTNTSFAVRATSGTATYTLLAVGT